MLKSNFEMNRYSGGAAVAELVRRYDTTYAECQIATTAVAAAAHTTWIKF